MKVAPDHTESKHLFEKIIDTEQVFVMGWRHDEHRFDNRSRSALGRTAVTPDGYNGSDGRDGSDGSDGKDLPMTALLTAPLPEDRQFEPVRPGRPELRLVLAPEYRSPRLRPAGDSEFRADVHRIRAPRRRVSAGVRRRRTLFAMMGLALALLAVPLSGSGGASHTTGSTLAANGPVLYTVRAGDSLWSIAERMDPSGDSRPIVAQLASEIGSDTVVPGEQITLP